jgi:hypothetical protein
MPPLRWPLGSLKQPVSPCYWPLAIGEFVVCYPSFICSTMSPMNHWTRIRFVSLIVVFIANVASGQTGRLASATDVARYLAGMPVSPGSPLEGLTRDPQWIAHSNAMNSSFNALDQRQINNIRIWRTEALAPVTQANRVCLYLFGGPDFLYANAFFPNASAYVLQGLEPVESIPDLLTLSVPSLDSTLQNIEASLNPVLNFSYFETKDMRSDFSRSQLKGVLPVIFVFIARSGLDIAKMDYISLAPSGGIISGLSGSVRGVRMVLADPTTGAQKTLYYLSSDLSDGFLKGNPAVLRFCERLGPTNSFLKAASYLMHQNSFNTVRNLLLQVSASILQDDSGIPIRYLTADRWTLRVFGSYPGPIDLFKNYFQPELRNYYATSNPKPLTFGFGYQINYHTSTLILAVRKR